MTVILPSHCQLTVFALGTVLVCGSGCDTDHAPVAITPKVAPDARAVEDLKKDIKPPVVIKPGGPVAPDGVPAAPKRES